MDTALQDTALTFFKLLCWTWVNENSECVRYLTSDSELSSSANVGALSSLFLWLRGCPPPWLGPMVPLARDCVLTANFLDASGVSAGERLWLLTVLHYKWLLYSQYLFLYLKSWPSCLLCKLVMSLYCHWMILQSNADHTVNKVNPDHMLILQISSVNLHKMKETGLKCIKCMVTKG